MKGNFIHLLQLAFQIKIDGRKDTYYYLLYVCSRKEGLKQAGRRDCGNAVGKYYYSGLQCRKNH